MKISIISVGKIKEKYLREAIDEYSKRLSKFCTLNITEVDEIVAKVENESNIKKSVELEGEEIISKLNSFAKNSFIFALDIDGKELSTIDFKNKISDIKLSGISDIVFVIGGSYGLSDEVKNRANMRLSFSKMTFPHQLFRLILLEQVYRAFKIENNEPYHK
jgi:23S rRNA (pseudouridine1915-N3)-methyltransferase